MKHKRLKRTAKGQSLRRKKKARHRPKIDKNLSEKLQQSKSRGDDFFTPKEISVPQTMLATGNLAITCQREKISSARYYQIMANIRKKWTMSWNTQNRANALYNKAKKLKSPLARHLTEVKRVELVEPTISAPERVETTTVEEPPSEDTQSTKPTSI